MNIELNKNVEVSREQVWLIAWISVASLSNTNKKDVATVWADECLKEFDIRFPSEN